MDCIFCKIANGEIPCYKIYEDDYVFSFLDANPDSDGHTLIIPKKHFIDLDDIDLETLKHINNASKKEAPTPLCVENGSINITVPSNIIPAKPIIII